MVPATPELERKLDRRTGTGRTARPGRQDGVRLAEFEGQRFAPPVALRGKIFCIGVNYGDRNAEYKDGSDQPKYPSVFMRTPGSLVGDGERILRPPESEQLDYEGEIVVVIGKRGRRIPRESAHAHIGGLTCGNEGSVRDWMRHGKFNVTQGKNFERSGAIGPILVTAESSSASMTCTLRHASTAKCAKTTRPPV